MIYYVLTCVIFDVLCLYQIYSIQALQVFNKKITFLFVFFLSSCASSPEYLEGSQSLNNPFDTLPQYAVEIRDELRLIAKARDLKARASVSSGELEQYQKELFADLPNFNSKVSIDMVAEADKFAKFISVAAQYDYIPPKNDPLSPVIVNIKLEDVSLYELLRELNAKVGSLAKIQVHTKPRRTMRFEYVKD